LRCCASWLIHLPASLRSRPITGPSSLLWTLWLLLVPTRQCRVHCPATTRSTPPRAGLPDSRTRPSDHSVSNPSADGRSASSGHVTHRRVEPRSLPHGSSPNGNSGLRHSLAGSPHLTGRIEFLIVRTGRSPPAAPHPVSPRRSGRLITSYVDSERTSTSLIVCALRRTSGGFTPPFSRRRYAAS
jgi:hypothetical protein